MRTHIAYVCISERDNVHAHVNARLAIYKSRTRSENAGFTIQVYQALNERRIRMNEPTGEQSRVSQCVWARTNTNAKAFWSNMNVSLW